MKRIELASPDDTTIDAALRAALDGSSVSPPIERAHVLAAAAAAAAHSRGPMRPSARPRRRRSLVPRRVPSTSLSAGVALFAGLPAKAAAATLVAATTVGGLAVTGNLPEQASQGLETASEKAGFTVPVGPEEDTTNVDGPAVDLPEEAVDGQERAAQAREEAAAKKAAGLAKAAAAPDQAGEAKDAGLERAAAGRDNAAAADDARANAASKSHAEVPGPATSGADERTARQAEAREQATLAEDEARSTADDAAGSATEGAAKEEGARSDAASREEDARTNAGGGVAP